MIKKETHVIAIDGYSSCGKSTLARALAKQLGYIYVDSGAMYRAATLYFLRKKVDWNDPTAVAQALQHIAIRFKHIPEEGRTHTLLNGEDVEEEIREMDVSRAVSPVATISAVRRAMVEQQRALGQEANVVMDGRDIGTVVFPNADLKIFLTADTNERVRRRYQELIANGKEVTQDDIRQNLLERDRIDSSRADSPLRRADDAILLNNTHLTEAEQLQKVMAMVGG